MVFFYRAAIVALATLVSAAAGLGMQRLLPAAYVADSKGMISSVVGLIASLLSLVLSLLIWQTYGLFITHQSQLRTIGRSIVHLDSALEEYGPEAEAGRAILREYRKRVRARLWGDSDNRRVIVHFELPADVQAMRFFFASLNPTTDAQRQQLATAKELFETIMETLLTVVRSLANPAPDLLLNVVLGWSCILFFGYGLLSAVNVLTVVLAALGAVSVASAVFLILELSDPYSGLFKMPHDPIDAWV